MSIPKTHHKMVKKKKKKKFLQLVKPTNRLNYKIQKNAQQLPMIK